MRSEDARYGDVADAPGTFAGASSSKFDYTSTMSLRRVEEFNATHTQEVSDMPLTRHHARPSKAGRESRTPDVLVEPRRFRDIRRRFFQQVHSHRDDVVA